MSATRSREAILAGFPGQIQWHRVIEQTIHRLGRFRYPHAPTLGVVMRFTPQVTVATSVEDQGRYLMVEDISTKQVAFHPPAGHLEASESLIEAACRETLEET